MVSKQVVKLASTLPQLFDLYSTGGAASGIPSASARHPSAHNVNENKPGNLSSYLVDPTAAYENKPELSSTAYASARLAIDVLKESSDAFAPLKSVAGGLSAILKHYDVRCTRLFQTIYTAHFLTSKRQQIVKQ